MVRLIKTLLATALMTTLLVSGNTTSETDDWMQSFTPRRTLHVSPEGVMGGADAGTAENPMHLLLAIQNAQPGDQYLLHGGDYPGGWILSRAGTSEAPIVYRAAPGERARIVGAMRLNEPHNWLWGLEITDPDNLVPHDGVGVFTSDVRLINNIIHHHCDDNGLGAWDTGEGQVFYGNIIYMNGCDPTMTADGSRLRHPHNVYTQNNFETHGLKYFVANLILDEGCSNGCTSFAAYTERGNISGYVVEDNIFANGVVLHGGFSPVRHVLYRDNAFFDTNVRFGYRDPTQVEFIGNYLGDSALASEWFWAEDTQKTGANVVTDNTFVSQYVRLQTAIVERRRVSPGTPPIDDHDIWDRNTYIGSFNGRLIANGVSRAFENLTEWQELTGDAGNAFDSDATFEPDAVEPHVVLIPNEYEPDTTYIAIYNWSNASSVTVELAGSNVVYDANNLFGNPVSVGANTLQIPLSGTFGVFVACTWGEGSAGCL